MTITCGARIAHEWVSETARESAKRTIQLLRQKTREMTHRTLRILKTLHLRVYLITILQRQNIALYHYGLGEY